MNILFVAQRYHPFVGGVETQTRLLAQELSKQHHVEVAAVTFEPSKLPQKLLVLNDSLLASSFQDYLDGNVAVHALTPTWSERLRMLPISVRAIPRLRRYRFQDLRMFGYRYFRKVYVPRLRELMRGADVVHSVAGGYLGWAAQEAARQEQVPFVCTPYVHPGQHGDDPASVAYYQSSDAVLALLETDRTFLRDLGVPDEKVHISGVVPLLPSSADPAGFRARHGLREKPIVLFVGRMVGYKGVPALIEAARHVWDIEPQTHFLFVGPADAEADGWFNASEPRIRYLGRVSDQEKADALAACDVFCMPSDFEILPAVYLEAWSYAKPVVGGKAHGLPELIEGNGAGVTVSRDARHIADALIRLLLQPELASEMGRRGRMLVQERYTKEALVQGLLTVYDSVDKDIRTVADLADKTLAMHQPAASKP